MNHFCGFIPSYSSKKYYYLFKLFFLFRRIQLQFISFDLGVDDYVNVSEGIRPGGDLIETFSMSHRPPQVFIGEFVLCSKVYWY